MIKSKVLLNNYKNLNNDELGRLLRYILDYQNNEQTNEQAEKDRLILFLLISAKKEVDKSKLRAKINSENGKKKRRINND